MPISAMPEHLNTPEKIDKAFPDDDQYGTNWFGRLYRWYQKGTKTWFVFSYRCTEWWAQWRKYPRVLFAARSKQGVFRAESVNGEGQNAATVLWNTDIWLSNPHDKYVEVFEEGYLSRIQYWCRWHVAIQWPLMVSFHFYPKSSDVPKYGEPRPDLDGKVWFFYWNHFDADLLYWMVTSGYLGRNWK